MQCWWPGRRRIAGRQGDRDGDAPSSHGGPRAVAAQTTGPGAAGSGPSEPAPGAWAPGLLTGSRWQQGLRLPKGPRPFGKAGTECGWGPRPLRVGTGGAVRVPGPVWEPPVTRGKGRKYVLPREAGTWLPASRCVEGMVPGACGGRRGHGEMDGQLWGTRDNGQLRSVQGQHVLLPHLSIPKQPTAPPNTPACPRRGLRTRSDTKPLRRHRARVRRPTRGEPSRGGGSRARTTPKGDLTSRFPSRNSARLHGDRPPGSRGHL